MDDVFDVLAEDHEDVRQALAELEKGPTAATGAGEDQLMLRKMISPEEGARTTIYCATAPELAAETGHYYDSCQLTEPSEQVTPELAAELWRRSADWVAAAAAPVGV